MMRLLILSDLESVEIVQIQCVTIPKLSFSSKYNRLPVVHFFFFFHYTSGNERIECKLHAQISLSPPPLSLSGKCVVKLTHISVNQDVLTRKLNFMTYSVTNAGSKGENSLLCSLFDRRM